MLQPVAIEMWLIGLKYWSTSFEISAHKIECNDHILYPCSILYVWFLQLIKVDESTLSYILCNHDVLFGLGGGIMLTDLSLKTSLLFTQQLMDIEDGGFVFDKCSSGACWTFTTISHLEIRHKCGNIGFGGVLLRWILWNDSMIATLCVVFDINFRFCMEPLVGNVSRSLVDIVIDTGKIMNNLSCEKNCRQAILGIFFQSLILFLLLVLFVHETFFFFIEA